MMMSEAVATSQPWYRSLNRSQWNILLAANLGWLFDGFELYALFLTVGPAMRALLGPSQYPQIPVYIGMVVAITLLGWGIGGIVGGLLADYIGRKRTMILAILAYSITTGLTAISFDWVSFAFLRFLVGIAIGSEWATGSSMMAELWPITPVVGAQASCNAASASAILPRPLSGFMSARLAPIPGVICFSSASCLRC